jgi:hypothetical protein
MERDIHGCSQFLYIPRTIYAVASKCQAAHAIDVGLPKDLTIRIPWEGRFRGAALRPGQVPTQ